MARDAPFLNFSDLRKRLSADACASAEPQGERKTMTVPQACPRRRKPLDAGVFQGEIGSFRLHLAAEGKAAKTVRTYTGAVAWFAAAHLIPRTSQTTLGAGRRPRRAEVAGPSADPVQRRVCQQPVPGAAAVLQMARRGRADPRPDGPAARAESDREAGAGVHQRRTIGPGKNLPGSHLRPAPRRSSDRGTHGERDPPANWPGSATTRTTPAAATSTCSSARSPSAARAAGSGSSGSGTRQHGLWTATSASGQSMRRRGGLSCGLG